MLNEVLQNKVRHALDLLRSIAAVSNSPIEIAYSCGKDSEVILQLARESGIPFRAIFRNTTIDPKGTIAHARSKGVEIRNPRLPFFKLIEKKGYPSRLVRFCCDELKEYKILDKCVIGVRKAESKARDERYQEPTQCRVYKRTGDRVEAIYPILTWSDEDVAEFLLDRQIKCHPLYYDADGNFDVTKRLGCIGCPLAYYKRRVEEFKQYPQMVALWLKSGQVYLNTHRHTKNGQRYKTAYEMFFRTTMFNHTKDYLRYMEEHNYQVDYKSVLEETFGISLPTLEVL